jgi:peptidyl-prolyl cis-trans isomerase A (cyclophilin A)
VSDHTTEFVVQFGIASEPNETEKWETTIPDDPVLQSNTYGYVSFATSGADTRTTQIFINLADNSGLDDQGFSPFAKVIQGMDVVENMLYNPTPYDDGGVDQTSLSQMGNAWLLQEYPDVDLIKSTAFGTEKGALNEASEGQTGGTSAAPAVAATCFATLAATGAAAVMAVVLL